MQNMTRLCSDNITLPLHATIANTSPGHYPRIQFLHIQTGKTCWSNDSWDYTHHTAEKGGYQLVELEQIGFY